MLYLVVQVIFFGKAGQEFEKDYTRNGVRTIIPAWRLCKTKDTAHQECLNLKGIEALWITEDLDDYERGVIVSKSVV